MSLPTWRCAQHGCELGCPDCGKAANAYVEGVGPNPPSNLWDVAGELMRPTYDVDTLPDDGGLRVVITLRPEGSKESAPSLTLCIACASRSDDAFCQACWINKRTIEGLRRDVADLKSENDIRCPQCDRYGVDGHDCEHCGYRVEGAS